VAVGPHQLAALSVTTPHEGWTALRRCTDRLTYESTTTVYLAYAQTEAFTIARLDDAPGQWVFDRGDLSVAGRTLRLLALVISASGPHDRLDHDTLLSVADAQLRRARPSLPTLAWGRVIAERRATYACTPGLVRPTAGRITP